MSNFLIAHKIKNLNDKEFFEEFKKLFEATNSIKMENIMFVLTREKQDNGNYICSLAAIPSDSLYDGDNIYLSLPNANDLKIKKADLIEKSIKVVDKEQF